MTSNARRHIHLGNRWLEIRCEPSIGGRISHVLPSGTSENLFHWNPPGLDLRQLTRYVPIGGWKEMAVHADCSFPGPHWNLPFEPEEQDGVLSLTCEAGGLRLTRLVSLVPGKAAMQIVSECENISQETLRECRLQAQPMLRPGGGSPERAVVLIPQAAEVRPMRYAVPGMQPQRVGSHEQAPASNWWACCDNETGQTLLIADEGSSAVLNLFHDSSLLIMHNYTGTRDLKPGERLKLKLALHAYSIDLTPYAEHLGASRFVPAADMLLGLALSATEVSPGDALELRLQALSLTGEAQPAEATFTLVDSAGKTIIERSLELRQQDTCLASATMTIDTGDLPVADYRAVLMVGDESVETVLQVVTETRQQRKQRERQELQDRLQDLAKRVADVDGGDWGVALMRQDLAVAGDLQEQGDLAGAAEYATFIDAALEAEVADQVIACPAAQEVQIAQPWLASLEASIPDLPEVRREVDYYGSSQLGEFDTAWYFRDDAQLAYLLTLLAFLPTKFEGRSDVIQRAVLLVDCICRSFADGRFAGPVARDRNSDRFVLVPFGEAIRLLLELPLSPARKSLYRRVFCAAVDYQIEAYGGKEIPQGGYLNQDVMYLLAVRLAHQLTGDARYLKECDYILSMMEAQLLPDGAYYYIYPHNEVAGYHQINLAYLCRDWVLSGEQRSRALVARTVEFYPLMVDHGGWVESSSQTWWKHTAYEHWPCLGPAIVAGVTGDGRNQYLAQQRPPGVPRGMGRLLTLYTAMVARDDIEPEAPADDWIVLDRNVKGPRGRFGPFTWVGTTAPYRDTFVGVHISEREREDTFSMHYAGPQVFFTETPETNTHRQGVGLAMSPEHYQSDVIVKEDRAVMGVRYHLLQYQQWVTQPIASDWRCDQLWYFDRERLVGLMVLEALRDTSACGVDLSCRFANYWQLSEEADEAQSTPLDVVDQGEYACGPLRLRVIAHNLAEELVTACWVCTYVKGSPGRGYYARTWRESGSFKAGERFYLLAELRPSTSNPADIQLLESATGFRLGSREVRLETSEDEVRALLDD